MDTQTRELIGLGLVAVGIFLGVSLFLGLGGPAGSLLEEGLRQVVGRAVALAPAVLIAMGIAFMLDHPLLAARPMRLGVAIGSISLLIALAGGSLGMGGTERVTWFDSGLTERGGYIGEAGELPGLRVHARRRAPGAPCGATT